MVLTAFAFHLVLAAAPLPAESGPDGAAGRDAASALACPSARPPVRRPPMPPRGRRHLRLGPGGLRTHEDTWGHCCRRHVGHTDQQLINRMRCERGLDAVSTFTNMKVAQSALRATLNHNSQRIWQWQVAGAPSQIMVRYTMPVPIGRYMTPSMNRPEPGRTAFFALRMNKHFPGGFQVITVER